MGSSIEFSGGKLTAYPPNALKLRIPFNLPSADEETDDSDVVSSSEKISTDDEEPPDASQEDREGNSTTESDRVWKLDPSLDCQSKKHRGYCDC